MKKYDFLIVGSGLSGAIIANEATKKGKTCLVIDKRDTVGGNLYTEEIENINVHMYGAHIFHTNEDLVWDYINKFAKFNNFVNSPIANFNGELYNLPFNMNTFNKMWGVITPQEALMKIEADKISAKIEKPKNLEEKAISLVGFDIYNKLVKGYTEKQWGRSATELPVDIINRLPVRFTYDNNYFNAKYQGIPIGGYTKIIEKMLENSEVKLSTDFYENKEYFFNISEKIIFTGMIDEFYDYCFGALEYRSLEFKNEILDLDNFQGNAVFNYTDSNTKYTRIIEHKFFENSTTNKTVITREYPKEWEKGEEPYYPINNEINTEKFLKYQKLSKKDKNIVFAGRLGLYKYFDMDQIIKETLDLTSKII